MSDFSGRVPEQPKETKVNDNIIDKLAREGQSRGEPGALKGDKQVAMGSDNSVSSLPKMAIDKGVNNQVAEVAKQFMPNMRDENAVKNSQQALGEMVSKAVKQAEQGNKKPAEDLSQAITVAAKSTEAHISDLTKRVDTVKSAMTKNTSMS